MKNEGAGKYLLIASLYVSQAVPLGFFTIAVPAILRAEGTSLQAIGLVAALALPWLLKFLWAPLVDGWGSSRFGHYRTWIVPLQTASVVCVAVIAYLQPGGALLPLLFAGAAFMLCSATQDIATDGLAVRLLARSERGAGNGIQVGGYYLGQILGGGAVLVAYSRFGWTASLLAMAFVLALPLIPVAAVREPDGPGASRRTRPDYGALGRFFRRPGIGAWIVVLVLYRAAEQMAVVMLNPMLVDRGWSLEQVGLMLGLAASVGALGGSLTGGLLVNPLGRRPSLVVFGFLQTASLGGFLLAAAGLGGNGLIWTATVVTAFAGGMATAALYTNMMDRCDPAHAGTDFTIQQALCAVGPVVAASLAGFSAEAFGYAGHFALCAGLGLATLLLVTGWLEDQEWAPLADLGVCTTSDDISGR